MPSPSHFLLNRVHICGAWFLNGGVLCRCRGKPLPRPGTVAELSLLLRVALRGFKPWRAVAAEGKEQARLRRRDFAAAYHRHAPHACTRARLPCAWRDGVSFYNWCACHSHGSLSGVPFMYSVLRHYRRWTWFSSSIWCFRHQNGRTWFAAAVNSSGLCCYLSSPCWRQDGGFHA